MGHANADKTFISKKEFIVPQRRIIPERRACQTPELLPGQG
jgi:hypothetical protein